MKDIFEKASQIKLLIFDVDGVLTDGSLFLGDDGQEYKAFHSQDGHGIKMLQRHGVRCAIITGRSSQVVEHRMRNLGIDLIYQGQHDKLVGFADLLKRVDLSPEQVAYIGDDVVDLPVKC
jgi:3-deoxy-D-manno-octulosonate 8-phosphate phosphatase (KDO 8-P phosphatase)